jgi:hypothetical protein
VERSFRGRNGRWCILKKLIEEKHIWGRRFTQ